MRSFIQKLNQVSNYGAKESDDDKTYKIQSTYKILKENKNYLNLNCYQKAKDSGKRLINTKKEVREKFQDIQTFEKYFEKKEID